MTTIYTTQTEFTRNTTIAAVESAWNNTSLSKEQVASELNTVVRVLMETRRKNKRFGEVMTSKREKGLPGYIVGSGSTESVVEEVTPQQESTKYSFRQITRDGENVVKVDIIVGLTTISDITKQLTEQGMSLSKNIEFLVTGYQIPLTPAEVLSGQETDFTVRQQVQGG